MFSKLNSSRWMITIAVIILAMAIYNAFDDSHEMDEHRSFFIEVRDFMERGGRNTAEMGYRTCVIQNIHSEHIGDIPLRDCCMEYYPEDSTCGVPNEK